MILLSSILLLCVCSAYTQKQPSAGGECEYKQYEGRAKIVSIEQKNKPPDHPHDIFEVKFSFSTDQVIEERFAQTEGRKFELLLDNSDYPGPKFLEKYGVKVGKVFECYMKVITKGTCTPILFEFPTIKLDDYFEN